MLGLAVIAVCYRHLQDCDSPDSDCRAHLVMDGVLLNGLSKAVHLELIAEPEMISVSRSLHIPSNVAPVAAAPTIDDS